jgi:hypothetical protein
MQREDVLNSLQNLMRAAENSYVDGQPLHCHSSKKGQSIFHVVSHEEFENLSDAAILKILRLQHIVVHGQPHKAINTAQAARMLGGHAGRRIDIQGAG